MRRLVGCQIWQVWPPSSAAHKPKTSRCFKQATGPTEDLGTCTGLRSTARYLRMYRIPRAEPLNEEALSDTFVHRLSDSRLLVLGAKNGSLKVEKQAPATFSWRASSICALFLAMSNRS
jgi:hypothetical protein